MNLDPHDAKTPEPLTVSQWPRTVDKLTISMDPGAGTAAPPPPPRLLGYTVLERISRGGQGTVFRAIQQSTRRSVALKVISGGPFVNPSTRARFNREVAVLAELNHPYIVAVVDRGTTADGSLFLAMDYVEGQSLDALVSVMSKAAAEDPRPLLRTFLSIAGAVEAAHARGIVHRDLKPANIRIDTRGEPRVLDFGLARLVDESAAAKLSVAPADAAAAATVSGHIIGSLPWSSPEQVAGRSDLDARTDVYSLGVMLYQLLTGHFPYPVKVPFRHVLKNIQSVVPRRPSLLAAGQRWGRLAPALDAVVLKALEKSPEKRYPSAGALAAELESCLADGRPLARRDAARRRHHRWLAAAIVLALAVAVGEQTKVWWLRHRARPPFTVVPLPLLEDSMGIRFRLIPCAQVWHRVLGPQFRDDYPLVFGPYLHAPFFLAVTEVTQGQYQQVMGMNPSDSGDPAAIRPDLPVNNVSFLNALEFCRRMEEREHAGYRLPTELEWEYACRAGTRGEVAGTGQLREMGWSLTNSRGHLHPVASKQCNHFGLYDMQGGVWEWCEQENLGTTLSTPPKPFPRNYLHGGDFPKNYIRGGSFMEVDNLCGSTARQQWSTKQGRRDLGFRVAREVPSDVLEADQHAEPPTFLFDEVPIDLQLIRQVTHSLTPSATGPRQPDPSVYAGQRR